MTDANILAYETPPQKVYRTRAASRTAQTKRTTRNQAKKVTKSEDSVLDEPPSTEEKKTPILNFNSQSKEVSVTYDNSEPNVFVKGAIPPGQSLASHVFSPPMGKPGKGHVKTKVHAYEEYIEYKSPSSKQVVSQSPVPETPEQKDTITVSGETCQDTPEVVSHGKRSSVRQSLKTASTRKSLLKSSKIQMNPSLLHGTENEVGWFLHMCKDYSSKIIQENRNTNLFFSLERGSRSTVSISFRTFFYRWEGRGSGNKWRSTSTGITLIEFSRVKKK